MIQQSVNSSINFNLPVGSVMFAPSTIACAQVWSSVSAAALNASQISFRPSKAGAVSQNSSLLDLSWPSVSGISEVHGGRSFFNGWFRPKVTRKNKQQASVDTMKPLWFYWYQTLSRRTCHSKMWLVENFTQIPPGVLPNWSLELTRTLGSLDVPIQPPILTVGS